VELYKTPKSGSIFWRNLPDSDGLTDISRSVERPKDGDVQPISTSFCVDAFRDAPMATAADSRIVLSNFVTEIPTSAMAKLGFSQVQQHLVLYAPFLHKGVKIILTKPDQQVALWPVFTVPEYLKSKCLQVELWTRDPLNDEGPVGIGTISLRRAFGEKPAEFVCSLTLEDEVAGTISGTIQVLKLGESEKPESSPAAFTRRNRQLSMSTM